MGTGASEDRFQQIYRAHRRQVLAYFLRRIDGPAASDGAAETFLVAWRRIDQVPGGDAALPWLYGVARRVLANQYRSRRRSGALEQRLSGYAADEADTPEILVLRRAEDEEMLAAVRRLKATDQEVLLLAVWEELPHSEIGEIVGASTHAVTQRLYRIKRALARDLHTHQAGPRASASNGGANQ